MRENASPNVDARPGARPDTGLDPWGVQAVGRRIACVWLPRFGLTVASRLDRLRATAPPLAGATPLDGAATNDAPAREGGTRDAGGLTGVALYRPGTRWQELLECSPDLEAAGIRPGLPLKDAQARVPGATYLPGDDVTLRAIAAAFVPVLDALDAFSPLVEPAPDGDLGAGQAVAYVDVAGLELLYGPELRLGEGLAKAAGAVSGGVAGVAGVGIASSKFVAWVAATRAGVTPSA
ncbi:MAG: hypothetical protein M3442_20175, partial [Chloroflexota bacterium]|nr:hypothetical protein [Chloroflexota bacterium]